MISNMFLQPAWDVPTKLIEQPSSGVWFVGLILATGFLAIALGKRLDTTVLGASTRTFFSAGTEVSMQKYDLRLGSFGSLLLLVNFVLSAWVCAFLFMRALGFEVSLALVSGSLAFVVSCVLYELGGLFLLGWISGEMKLMRTPILQSISLFPFAGLVFFAVAVIWYLNPNFKAELFFATGGIFLFLLLFRIVKGFTSAIAQGISWYYIILYFCTLEILPILVLYYYLERNFNV